MAQSSAAQRVLIERIGGLSRTQSDRPPLREWHVGGARRHARIVGLEDAAVLDVRRERAEGWKSQRKLQRAVIGPQRCFTGLRVSCFTISSDLVFRCVSCFRIWEGL